MNPKSKTVIFFGNEHLATGVDSSALTIKALHEAGYTIAALVSNQKKISSRNQKISTIASSAEAFGIQILTPQKIGDSIQQLRDLHADIGVLVAYGQIIPQSVIDIFPYGIINIHPSLLPKHRGSTPIESVILDGETETGVSIMQLVKAMDAGPIYSQKKIPLTGHETKQALCDTLLNLGAGMIIEVLPRIFNGSLQPKSQDDAAATVDNQIYKNDGLIDWSEDSLTINRKIRAYSIWPGSRTKLGDIDVVVTDAHIVDGDGKPGTLSLTKHTLAIATEKGSLAIDRLKPIGKNEMSIAAFLSGYSNRL